MNKSSDQPNPTRREFAKTIVGALALVPLSASVAAAQNPAPSPSPSPSPTPAPGPSPLAIALMGVAKVRFGDLMTEEQATKLQTNLEGLAATSGRLRAVKLKNGDEPDLVFSA